MAVRVRLRDLSKRYGEAAALDQVTIEVEPGELFFLIGPSGCGKTTLLRAIAGFVEPDAGVVLFDDRDMTAVPPYKRNTALVFQGYALWPHMTVEQNVEYGLRVRGQEAGERRRRVGEILDVVQMAELARRYPGELSAGQQQRVALARAIVVTPDVLLLDEPLSNLDARLRVEMRREILRIHGRTGITTIYVTHDQKEALSMGQRIAILDRGRIAQIGRPDECYRRPRTRFVARFLGEANFIEGEVARVLEGGGCEVATAVGILVVKEEGGRKKDECGMRNAECGIREKDECGMRNAECGIRQNEKRNQEKGLPDSSIHPSSFMLHPSVGQRVCCCFRPESVRMVNGSDEREVNSFRARVARATYLGEMLEYELTAGDGSVGLLATVMGGDWAASEGSEPVVAVAPEDIVLL